MRGQSFLLNALEGMVEGRRRYQLLDDIKVKGRYALMKRTDDREQ